MSKPQISLSEMYLFFLPMALIRGHSKIVVLDFTLRICQNYSEYKISFHMTVMDDFVLSQPREKQ